MSVNSRLKATKIIGQRKAFYKQRIPDSSCTRKETVHIDIIVTSRNGHRKIMQYLNNEQTFLKKKEKKEVEPVEPVLRNIYQSSNTYRNDLNWPQFNDEPGVQEKQQVKDQQPFIFVFVACLAIPSNNQRHQPRYDNSIPYMGVQQIYRDTEQPQEKETSQNKLKLQFSWRKFQQQR